VKRTAGITLIELLVAAVMFAIIAAALGRAFMYAVQYQMQAPKTRQAAQSRILLEDQIARVLQGAYLSSDRADTSTYLVSFTGAQSGTQSSSSGAVAGQAPQNTQSSSVNDTGQPSDGIVLTTMGSRLPPAYLASSDTDLETLNDRFGPQGGVSEVSLSTTAVGDAGDKAGLFIREQKPADSDHTQGGTERVLDSAVASIAFEFYDGTQWLNSWDTTAGQRRLPAAIRVTYTLTDDPDTNHAFVVRVPLSDVTPNNPVSNGGTISTAGPTPTTGAGGRAAPSLNPALRGFGLSGQLPLWANLQIQPEAPAEKPREPIEVAPLASHGRSAPAPSVESTPETFGDTFAGGVANGSKSRSKTTVPEQVPADGEPVEKKRQDVSLGGAQ
jgi:type II secretory pathway pseudopilin PulG